MPFRAVPHAFLQAFADDRPIAQILGRAPRNAQFAAADFAQFIRHAVEKPARRLRARLIGQDHHKPVAARRPEHQRRQLQFGQQRARHGFADEDKPHRTCFERTIIPVCRRREQEIFSAPQPAL